MRQPLIRSGCNFTSARRIRLKENFFEKICELKQNRLISFREYAILFKQVGSLAQLGEHLPYKQRVIGSIPIASTITVRIVFYAGIAQW